MHFTRKYNRQIPDREQELRDKFSISRIGKITSGKTKEIKQKDRRLLFRACCREPSEQ